MYVGASGAEYKDLVVSRLRAKQLFGGEWGRVPPMPADAAAGAVRSVATPQKYTMVGLLMNMIACNVSGTLDLHGPALVTDAACSFRAIGCSRRRPSLASRRLRRRDCRRAYTSICTPDLLIGFQPGASVHCLWNDVACRPFGPKKRMVLCSEKASAWSCCKRLEDALRDRDHIWALVQGVGLNNDGRGEGPMTPRLSGQWADALARAYKDDA